MRMENEKPYINKKLGGVYMKEETNLIKNTILDGQAVLGIELGSTRIKAVLIGANHDPIAAGSHEWENQFKDGMWSYALEDVWTGIQECYQDLKKDVFNKYQVSLKKVKSIGFSAMMHGYLVFDKENELLVPFRTWRNSTTGHSAEQLSKLFNYNIPQRWSIAHLYQAILNEEAHVKEAAFLTTLAGYVHWQLTGEKVLGVGDASGMFPIDGSLNNYNESMLEKFDDLIAEKKYTWKLKHLLPKVLSAGGQAGVLTEAGAALLDITGELEAGSPLCPPEGDAGTGMAATNSISVRTGNVSAGTSIFAMVVLEKELSKMYPEIDMVTTPDGKSVAMVHANNCTSDLNAWVNLFKEFAESMGMEVNQEQLFSTLYQKALVGDADCGGMLSYGYFAGEDIMGLSEGRPLFVRSPESNFNLANFMRTHLYSSCGALKVGMNLLMESENVKVEKMLGHGGLFKTKDVGQKIMAAAINVPIYIMETAGEGGPWGMALLAAYMANKETDESLDNYLDQKVFAQNKGHKMLPDPVDVKGFEVFIQRYIEGIQIEKAAVKHLV